MKDLRTRMSEDLQLRGYSPATQKVYLWAVTQLARFYHQSPEELTEEQLRAYFLHLSREQPYAISTLKIALAGIQFLYRRTLRRPWPVVTFRYRDNRTQEFQRVRLPVADFLRRFLQHVLPKGLPKVRHYGLNGAACGPRRTKAAALLQQKKRGSSDL